MSSLSFSLSIQFKGLYWHWNAHVYIAKASEIDNKQKDKN
jgi:hypothetical protein